MTEFVRLKEDQRILESTNPVVTALSRDKWDPTMTLGIVQFVQEWRDPAADGKLYHIGDYAKFDDPTVTDALLLLGIISIPG